MKKALYNNRYGDEIVFEDIEKDKVLMRDYDAEYCRYGFANDWSDAYAIYQLECATLQEPDYTLLIEDEFYSKLREMTFPEFVYEVEAAFHNEKHPFYKKYNKFYKTDKSFITMFDPAGGPYITIGTDLKLFFKDKKTRIVQEIDVRENQVIFTVSGS